MSDTNSFNLASESRWLCTIPIKNVVQDESDDLVLNLTHFVIPEFELTTSKMTYLGDSVEVPTGLIKPDEKRLVFTYLISSNWKQYLSLYRWLQSMSINNFYTSTVVPDPNIPTLPLQDPRLPINVTILSEFKKPIFNIKFKNCFLVGFGNLELNYTGTDNKLEHSFTVTYTDFEFSVPAV